MCFFNQHLGFLHSPVGFLLSNTAFSLSNRAFPFLGFLPLILQLFSSSLSVAIYRSFSSYLPFFRQLSTILTAAICLSFGSYLPLLELQSFFTTLPSRRLISTCPSS